MVTLGLVVAEFYEELATEMEATARSYAEANDADIVVRVGVPGVYDAPLAADRLARREAVDAVVVLGVVITGDTDHDRVIAHAAAQQLSAVSLDRDTPVTFGVQGPNMSSAEAHQRIEKGAKAVIAAVDLVETLPCEPKGQ